MFHRSRSSSNLLDNDIQSNEISSSDRVHSAFRRPTLGLNSIISNQRFLPIRSLPNRSLPDRSIPIRAPSYGSNSSNATTLSTAEIEKLVRNIRQMQERERIKRNQARSLLEVSGKQNPMSGLSITSKNREEPRMYKSHSLAYGIDNLDNDRSNRTRNFGRVDFNDSRDGLLLSSRFNQNPRQLLSTNFPSSTSTSTRIRDSEPRSISKYNFNVGGDNSVPILKSKQISPNQRPNKYMVCSESAFPKANSYLWNVQSQTKKTGTSNKNLSPKKNKDLPPPQIEWLRQIASRKGCLLNQNENNMTNANRSKRSPDKQMISRSHEDLISADVPWLKNDKTKQLRKILRGKRLFTQKSDSELLTRF